MLLRHPIVLICFGWGLSTQWCLFHDYKNIVRFQSTRATILLITLIIAIECTLHRKVLRKTAVQLSQYIVFSKYEYNEVCPEREMNSVI